MFSPLRDLAMVTVLPGSWLVRSTLCFMSFRKPHPTAPCSNNTTQSYQQQKWPSPNENRTSLISDAGRLQTQRPDIVTAPYTWPAPRSPVESGIVASPPTAATCMRKSWLASSSPQHNILIVASTSKASAERRRVVLT